MFTLVKWYLDVVADDGTVFIGYSGRARWGHLEVRYAASLVSRPDEPAVEEHTFTQQQEPAAETNDATIRWRPEGLGIDGSWHRLSQAIDERLLHTDHGDIDWHCIMPRARAAVEARGRLVSGLGYVERLTLTLPPWRLPFRRLAWGRFTSPKTSLVWIRWSDGDRREFVWQDSAAGTSAILNFGPPRDVCARPALARLNDHLPVPLRRLAAPLSVMHEHKMVARSDLRCEDGRIERGWSLYEEVRW